MIERDWTTKAGLRAVCYLVVYHGVRRHRCGYVEVPNGHPLSGVGYSEQCAAIPQEAADNATLGDKSPILLLTAARALGEEGRIRRSPEIVFDCHGGLTFSGAGAEGYPIESEGWWFGFDCAHAGDGALEPFPEDLRPLDGEQRTEDYVVAECERLAEQIVQMFPAGGRR